MYEYHLTYRSVVSVFEEWYGVVHAADIQVGDSQIYIQV